MNTENHAEQGADVFQHCLYNQLFPVMEHEKARFQNLLTEFGILRTV